MLKPEFLEKIALFFHLALLDEARAQGVVLRVVKKIRREQIKAKISGKELMISDIVRITSDQLKFERVHARPVGLAFSSGALILPANSNFGPWFEFQKIADEKDFVAVLYSKILTLPDEEIATGLGVSVGSIRYRVSNGLKNLGRICHLGGRESES